MKKSELKTKLLAGYTLTDCFEFQAGQECEIFKAPAFNISDDILYIPDVYLNELSQYLDQSVKTDCEENTDEIIADILSCCYTGEDFLAICNGDISLAEHLFRYCDWQHPDSALPEVEDSSEEDQDMEPVQSLAECNMTAESAQELIKALPQFEAYAPYEDLQEYDQKFYLISSQKELEAIKTARFSSSDAAGWDYVPAKYPEWICVRNFEDGLGNIMPYSKFLEEYEKFVFELKNDAAMAAVQQKERDL